MPIQKRTFKSTVAGPAEPRQVDHDTLADYLRHCKSQGLTDLIISIPLSQAPKYGITWVSIDELIKLVEKPSLTLPKEKPGAPIKLRPIKKLAKVKRNVRGFE
jgi:hypothetical protein